MAAPIGSGGGGGPRPAVGAQLSVPPPRTLAPVVCPEPRGAGPGITPSSSSRTRTPASINATPANINLADLTRAVNALPQNMTSQMFSAIAAVTGQGQNPNATPAQWASSQYGYGGSGGGSSAYHESGGLPGGCAPSPAGLQTMKV
ncbi:transcription elongation factor SPT6-like [Rhynochetos jubatus]